MRENPLVQRLCEVGIERETVREIRLPVTVDVAAQGFELDRTADDSREAAVELQDAVLIEEHGATVDLDILVDRQATDRGDDALEWIIRIGLAVTGGIEPGVPAQRRALRRLMSVVKINGPAEAIS
ncbi:MAG: hypothetical protein O7I42_08755 [Alphaproteobacteria bacterium]|nr:hypothetical protein [Alphaproteobacteria bacterium]